MTVACRDGRDLAGAAELAVAALSLLVVAVVVTLLLTSMLVGISTVILVDPL